MSDLESKFVAEEQMTELECYKLIKILQKERDFYKSLYDEIKNILTEKEKAKKTKSKAPIQT